MFSNYLVGDMADYFNARKIINGLDQADKIADITRGYSEILREAKYNLFQKLSLGSCPL